MDNTSFLSGLGAALQTAGGIGLQQQTENRELQRLAQIAEAKKREAEEKRAADDKRIRPEIRSFEATGADGTIKKVTNESRWNPETETYDNIELGSVVKPKAAPVTRNVPMGMNDTVQEFDPATGKWNEIGSGPRFAPRPLMPSAGEGKNKDEEFLTWYSGLTDEQRRLYDQGKGRAVRPDLDAKLMTIANSSLNARMRDFDKKEERDRKSDYKAFGIDPDAKDARKQLRNAMQEEIYGSYGLEMPVEETVEVIEAGPGNQPPARNPPGSSAANPLPVSPSDPKPPAGTWIKTPTGKIVQVR